MITWLLAIAVLLLLWSRLWRTQPVFAGGVLIGLPIAWLVSDDIRPYVTGMNEIPLWLPPLPFATSSAIGSARMRRPIST